MFTFRLLILSVAVYATAMLTTTNADQIVIDLVNLGDNEAEMEWSGFHDPGVVRRGSSDLELGYERTVGYGDEHDAQRVGLRYININIPAGSTINSAHIQFMADDEPDKTIFTPDNDPEIGSLDPLKASVSIYGFLSANSPPLPAQSVCTATFCIPGTTWTLTDITGGMGGPTEGVGSAITNVTAPVHWEDIPTWSTGDVNGNGVADPGDWDSVPGAAGPDQRTPNLASIVQQIVDLPGWAVNNAMSFLIDPMAVKDPLGDFDDDDDRDGIDFLKWQRDDLNVPINDQDGAINRAHWLTSWEENYGDLGSQEGVDDIFFQGNRTAVALNCGPSENRCVDFPVTPTAPVLTIDFTPPGAIGAASTAVPEPATGITLLVGMVFMLFRRNR